VATDWHPTCLPFPKAPVRTLVAKAMSTWACCSLGVPTRKLLKLKRAHQADQLRQLVAQSGPSTVAWATFAHEELISLANSSLTSEGDELPRGHLGKIGKRECRVEGG
jgi:hypothetical protein